MIRTLYIYNPEHDLALANGSENYTASAKIRAMRQQNALIQSILAKNEDLILLLDHHYASDYCNVKFDTNSNTDSKFTNHIIDSANQVHSKRIKLIGMRELQNLDFSNIRISPWGWDSTIVARLRRAGVPTSILPSQNSIAKLRELSHRRTAIQFLTGILPSLPYSSEIIIPQEIHNETQAVEFLNQHDACVFKAPWSSSGHGIQFGSSSDSPILIPWIRGIIREQGCVIGEKFYPRSLDWASEWEIENGCASFLGFSVFTSSGRGKYHGNILRSQHELVELIIDSSQGTLSLSDIQNIISHQEKLLNSLIAPHYEGMLGIDMLTTNSGTIHPCVEINLRTTMGHIALASSQS